LGNAQAPLLIPNSPNFINDDYHDSADSGQLRSRWIDAAHHPSS
jgi:hypothetical protein